MLEYRTDRIMEATVVRVSGEVDLSNAHALKRELQQQASDSYLLILDLSGIDYFDLSGVRAVEAVATFCLAHGGLLVLASPSLVLRRLLDLIQLGRRISIFDSREEARNYLRERSSRSSG